MKLTLWPLKGSRTLLKQHSTADHLCWRWLKTKILKLKFKYLTDSNADPISLLFNKKSNKLWLSTFSAFRPITFQNGCFFPSSFFNNEILILEIRLLNYKKPLSASVSDAKSMTYRILDIFKYSNLFDILDFRSSDLAIGVARCNSVKCVLILKSLCIGAQCNVNKDFTIYLWTKNLETTVHP